jgi:hypothetical protein
LVVRRPEQDGGPLPRSKVKRAGGVGLGLLLGFQFAAVEAHASMLACGIVLSSREKHGGSRLNIAKLPELLPRKT